MRILHTSDWHIGRTFFSHSTLEALEQVFDAMAAAVTAHRVDVVVAAGDIFDLSTPSAAAFEFLDRQLLRLRDAGAQLVLTPGNHDSAARLGARSAFASAAGVHVLTNPATLDSPLTIAGVHFYGIPFLEPAVMRTSLWQGVEPMRNQRDALTHALGLIRADLSQRGGPGVVLAHTFVQGADGESCDSERDIVGGPSVGGVDKVPVSAFDGITYAALGHIHGRSTLAEHVRYSGAPLHFSFSEAAKPRGAWLVDLDGDQLTGVEWLDFPVPRTLRRITGQLEELLAGPEWEQAVDCWVDAVLTDPVRPLDAMAKLQTRFPHCVHVLWQPPERAAQHSTYREILAKVTTDEEIVGAFLAEVRNGQGVTVSEEQVIGEVVAAVRIAEAAR